MRSIDRYALWVPTGDRPNLGASYDRAARGIVASRMEGSFANPPNLESDGEVIRLYGELRRAAEADETLRLYRELLEPIGGVPTPAYTPTLAFTYRISAA
jgi:hypothetical protein